MQGYDATLKLLLQSPPRSVFQQLFGATEIRQWLNAEMPQVRALRADLLGQTATGSLLHIELQSANDSDMPLRMAEYSLAIYRQFRQLPQQLVLYVGESEMRMETALVGPEPGAPDLSFRFQLLDFRDLSGAALLQSTDIEDNLLAVLTRLQDQRAIVQDVLRRIAELPESSRRHAFAQFLIISGLRRLEETVREEAHKMPILNDLLSHKVIGPAILQGRQEGREEGRQEGVQEVVRTLIGKRFGSVPEWVDNRLTNLSVSELDAIAVRLLDVPSLDLLFPGATK